MLRIFISGNILRTIIEKESDKEKGQQSVLFSILCNHKEVFISCNEADAEWIKKYDRKFGFSINTQKSDYIRGIPENHSSVLLNPSSIFILDISDADAKSIEKTYGVICRGSDYTDMSILINCFIVKAEHKLAAFDRNMGTAFQTITPQTLFTKDSLDRHSTSPLKSIEQTVSIIRNFSKSLPNQYDHSLYSYALNGKRVEKCNAIKNRLIKP